MGCSCQHFPKSLRGCLALLVALIWVSSAGASSGSVAGPQSTDPDRPTQLFTGQAAVNLSAGAGGQLHFFINVPDGASLLDISTLGGTGDVDLFVRFGSPATENRYDCASTASGNSERCSFQPTLFS